MECTVFRISTVFRINFRNNDQMQEAKVKSKERLEIDNIYEEFLRLHMKKLILLLYDVLCLFFYPL